MATHHSATPKAGILLVGFGSTVLQAQTAYERMTEKVQMLFPNMPIRWAYTSPRIRHVLARKGQYFDSVEMALARMMDDGFTHVAVQSLQVISGKENHELLVNCRMFGQMAGGFREIRVGLPLLSTKADMNNMAAALLAAIPKERTPEEAVVFVGHGSPHPSNAFYTALMFHLQERDPLVFLGTLSGWPDVADIQKRLLQRRIHTAWLLPCLAVAGNHALKDMAGDGSGSWKSTLEHAGIICKPVLKGLLEYDAVADIWTDHLKQIAGPWAAASDGNLS
jgi:sirohydrochlorin cobaltochelatase